MVQGLCIFNVEIHDLIWQLKLSCKIIYMNRVSEVVKRFWKIITARKRSLGQGNIFAPVCHSVHRGEYLTPHPQTRYTPLDQVHPPGPHTPPQTRYTHPRTRYTPRDQVHPRTRYTPLDQVHPCRPGPPSDQVHPPGPGTPPRPGTPP